jgi:cyclopropane-fatty-acyl-phospholipid synthase
LNGESSSETIRAKAVTQAGAGFMRGDGLLGWLWAKGPQRVMDMLHLKLRLGFVQATLPDGKIVRLGGHGPGPEAHVKLHNWRPVRRLIVGGHTAFAASYFDGDWESDDLTSLFHLFSLNRKTLQSSIRGGLIVRNFNAVKHAFRANTLDGSRRNISFHYDLGNNFYEAWLDPSMTYSSAIFAAGDSDLEAAQYRKYRRLLDLLDVKPGERILEIGCGWGGFAELAAKERFASVTGITLSQEQLTFAQNRVAKAGIADKVDLRLIDYRDVTPEVFGLFDHIVSIEMLEAVGEKYWQTYMDKVSAMLLPGGKVALQVITIDPTIFESYRRGADFIQTYIFPGGMLPTNQRLQSTAANANLTWLENKGFALDYAQTLAQWHKSFEAAFAAGKLPKEFDESFHRIWRYYLNYCEGGFRGGGIDVQQICLVKSA